ncbi:hypothetical protein GETHPA_01140 [Geothrix rubra]|uniref:DUF3857 domain-containing protein n=2 Tax=Geothrix rubra TaxID=2927977 RepID=A0ABQ5Q2C6_9BACT|nr:hypothetical protein GETHPA_01140 [Geothrix rubra]
MRHCFASASMLVCAALSLLAGPAFPPVGPEVWALHDSTTEGKGALVLEDHVKIHSRYAEFTQRIRILAPAGKGAAEFSGFDKDCYDIAGRTVLPDGQIIPFSRKDMATKTVAKVGYAEAERTVVVAPGVTDNCLVEIAWKQSKPYYDIQRMAFGQMERLTLSGPYPVQKVVVEIPKAFEWAWQVQTGGARKADRTEEGNFTVLTLEGLPGMDNPPYSVAGPRPACRIMLFPVPENLRYAASKGPDAYWNAVGRTILKDYFEQGIDKGRSYRNLLATLSAGLPEAPGPRAVELLKRLDGAIQNTTYPTYQEEALRSKKDEKAEIDPKDLDAAAERGRTTATGMMFLYWEMLKDLGLKPQVAMVVDRDRAVFDRKLLCWQQFNDLLIGVANPGGDTLWFDPSLRYAAPGVISQDYQGSTALAFDPQNWEAKAFHVPVQGSAVNQRRFDYTLDLGEDEDRFTLRASLTGLPEYGERRTFMALGQKEQNRALQDRLEQKFKGVTFTKAQVEHVVDPTQNVAWSVEGRIERDSGRRRTVDPFPANAWALWIPDRLDPVRKEPIVFPYASAFQEKSRFRIPKGYRLGAVPPYSQANAFGRVDWSMDLQEGDLCAVTVKVELSRPIAGASDYEAFKAFLGWVREACGRTLILERL